MPYSGRNSTTQRSINESIIKWRLVYMFVFRHWLSVPTRILASLPRNPAQPDSVNSHFPFLVSVLPRRLYIWIDAGIGVCVSWLLRIPRSRIQWDDSFQESIMVLPLLKLGTLALKTLSKPIAGRLKKEAGRHPKFRNFIISIAQVIQLPRIYDLIICTLCITYY